MNPEKSFECYVDAIGKLEDRFNRSPIAPHQDEHLKAKVSPEGKYLPFAGDTLLFPAPEDLKRWATEVQTQLFSSFQDVLAFPLSPHFFHITMHDLFNPLEKGKSSREEEVRKILPQLLERCKTQTIQLRAVSVYSGGSVAIGIGFIPHNEEDYHTWKRLRSPFDSLFPSDPLFHIHLTLDYYRPVAVPPTRQAALQQWLAMQTRNLREHPKTFPLQLSTLQHNRFSDMDHYQPILPGTAAPQCGSL